MALCMRLGALQQTVSSIAPWKAPAQGVAGAQHQQQHYWGQALQYLEKSADVVPGAPSRILSPGPYLSHVQWSITGHPSQ